MCTAPSPTLPTREVPACLESMAKGSAAEAALVGFFESKDVVKASQTGQASGSGSIVAKGAAVGAAAKELPEAS